MKQLTAPHHSSSKLFSYILVVLLLLSYFSFPTPSYAQTAKSPTCRAYIKTPLSNIPIVGPAIDYTNMKLGCGSGTAPSDPNTETGTGNNDPVIPGQYKFPLNLNSVTAISTEMAAYPGGYTYGGHSEHAGLDIGSPIGARVPVFAIADGVIDNARDSCYNQFDGWQCRFEIKHSGDKFISSYSHIDANSNLRVGAKVTKGQQIGVVHDWRPNGYSSMDHLHFELRDTSRNSNFGVPYNVNPRNYLPELVRWKPSGYGGGGAAVRSYTNSVGLFWADDGKEFADTYKFHPPCGSGSGSNCWAH